MKESFDVQKRYYDLGESYFWLASQYDGVMRFAKPLLGAMAQGKKLRILDAGCGCGNLITRLSQWGKVVGTDASRDALTFCNQRSSADLVESSVEQSPLHDDQFDFVFALQIIEHIENDLAAMKELYRVTKPGGFLIVTAPACMFLWGYHDEKFGHVRRYGKSELFRLAQNSKFIVAKICYLNFFSVLPLFLVRRFKRATKQKADDCYEVGVLCNRFLRKLINAETALASVLNLPVGTFLIAVLRKE